MNMRFETGEPRMVCRSRRNRRRRHCGVLAALALALAAHLPAAGPGPDPVRVVFSGQTEGGTWDLWFANEDGSSLRKAVETPDTDERTPVLSPDRKYVAYSTSRGDLYLYHLYDRTATRLTLPVKGRCAWPAWGNDGSGLYFVEVLMGKGPDEARIWRYEPTSGKAEMTVDELEVEGWPAVNEEGVLLFTRWRQSEEALLGTLLPGEKMPRVLWDDSLSVSGAAWLPNHRVAAVGSDEKGQKVVVFSKGMKVREFDVPGASGRPVGYHDGLLLTRIQNGKATIDVMDLANGQVRPWIATLPNGLVQMRDPDYR